MLSDEKLRFEVFNEKYLDGIERRRDALTLASLKSQIFIATGSLFLGLAVLSIHLPISILGLTASDAKSIREILLIALSSIQLARMIPEIEKANLTDLLRSATKALAKNEPVAVRALNIRYGVESPNLIPVSDFKQLDRWQKFTFAAGGVGLLGWLLFGVAGVILIQLLAMIDVLRTPSVSLKLSIFVVLYGFFVDMATIAVHRMTGVMSAYNYGWKEE